MTPSKVITADEQRAIDYLEDCLKHTFEVEGLTGDVWYKSGDSMLYIAQVLDDHDIFIKTSDVIYFFEKPWKYEGDMRDVINELKGIEDEEDEQDE